jgi:hypothetical protein
MGTKRLAMTSIACASRQLMTTIVYSHQARQVTNLFKCEHMQGQT